jgi:mRNA-degrading endonuclease RelE of RelBE toxin-antitoxin system
VYDLFIEPDVHEARDDVPGNLRQRVRRAITELRQDPRPSLSRTLDTSDLDLPPDVEIRRLRLAGWRVVYAISDQESWVWVLGLKRRPPYDYSDLPTLADKLRNSEAP